MPVDLRVKIRKNDREIEVVARANTAFSPEEDISLVNITVDDWENLGKSPMDGLCRCNNMEYVEVCLGIILVDILLGVFGCWM